jgi:hypothetical protein
VQVVSTTVLDDKERQSFVSAMSIAHDDALLLIMCEISHWREPIFFPTVCKHEALPPHCIKPY